MACVVWPGIAFPLGVGAQGNGDMGPSRTRGIEADVGFQTLGNTSVIGLQWGDEGKGKIVDLLTEHFDVVVRYAGGANAGHTVIVGDERFALHLLPSGILRSDVLNIVGPGVALDPEIICEEIEGLCGPGRGDWRQPSGL